MNEDRKRVLTMLADGKITAEIGRASCRERVFLSV